jgi:uncharacterized membrane protein
MSRIEKTVVVDASVENVYAQWTQFESFPMFMEGVDAVTQLDDRTLEWKANVGWRTKEWTARIVDQTPNTRIAWKSVEGAQNDGAVIFSPAGEASTEIRLVVDAEPEGIVETAGDALGFLDRRVGGDLDRFKEFIEQRGRPTGSWEGEIHGDEVRPDPDEAQGSGTTPQHAIGEDSAYGGPSITTLPGDGLRRSGETPSSGTAPD